MGLLGFSPLGGKECDLGKKSERGEGEKGRALGQVTDRCLTKRREEHLLKQGFSEGHNTWELDRTLDCPELISDFM